MHIFHRLNRQSSNNNPSYSPIRRVCAADSLFFFSFVGIASGGSKGGWELGNQPHTQHRTHDPLNLRAEEQSRCGIGLYDVMC